jgi:SNF2 family DNA or RNA helicase
MYTTWPEEIKRWAPHLTYTILHGPDKANNLHLKKDVYLINYEGIPWLFETLKRYWTITKRMPFRAVIFDEMSLMKSAKTKRFKKMKNLIKVFPKWKLALSATPAPKSLLDIWSQFYLLDVGKRLGTAMGRYQFDHFYPTDRNQYYWVLKPGAFDIIMNKIRDITYRLRAEDHLKLPDIIYNTIKVDLPPSTRAMYTELEKKFFIKLEGSQEIIASTKGTLSMKLRQFIQGGMYTNAERTEWKEIHTEKLKVLKELVDTSAGQPILCAIQFRFELEMIKRLYPDVPILAGGTSNKMANKYIKDWNEGTIPLLLCHPASISHGVNLQAAGHILLWYGMTWSPEQYRQLIGRLFRQGQKNTVIVHHLIVPRTIDTAILKAQSVRDADQKTVLEYLRKYWEELENEEENCID